MDSLIAARSQMEVSLAFHMIFAAMGIGMPLLMLIAEGLYLRSGQEHYRDLAHKWGKATALTFAVGAVSGTALSFELGLLWPRFMAFAGEIIGPAFALEGYAFFIEAIFIGLYLYGWEKLSPRAHWLAGVPVALSGMVSGVLVVAANAWMQTPTGFTLDGARAVDINPLATFLSPSWFQMALHSTLSCYISTGFAVAGVYALGMLRGRRDAYHRSGIAISLAVASIAAILQPLSGHISAQNVAAYQPAKLAAMESHFRTEAWAPIIIGGIPDTASGTVRGAIQIPGLLSVLVGENPNTVVTGLNDIPRDQWPNVLISHIAFQTMVGAAFAMIGLGLWYWWARRRRAAEGRWLLRALLAGSPLGFIALEAGWLVSEVGRQPWVIYGVMRTSAGVTPVAEVPITFFGFSLLYMGLGVALIFLLRGLATGAPEHSGQTQPQEAPNAA
ncbi:cytochrome ubiquinol oxidase subunit I [Oscillochloris sp. ZM17-4]|uniref:cytochrome ubiquinol oxidase subunit I n=1 Tax=Oscillochloris sp. ZM17-4 TaxID=2866714 RepID=UPI001C73243B|nr:cytochrome ubiquinol oxidase subunit I [Oscillochloris sp. ZM17-4]MBX0329321.1 cytochrome ubiquinol oxidase subunit I [Oscillochloris sp. ZM17-4]